ncbi:lactonase family protein [Pseudonocardia sp. TRM90224]|uniref:lactonase family protein n=1 Tax=Pseudonocardia sp. TRM90224 TaxID=2812678 RepID=UPI001E5D62EF|nr:beta-propeller fold lactonase family protein [Pseudonocardia sp. TRM90224]
MTRLWIGGYADGDAPEGIWRVDLDVDGATFGDAELAATVAAPSFLALHPAGHTLYAVSETGQGQVSAFVVDGATLTPRGEPVPSGGSGPCHLLATADAVLVANYNDGVAAELPLLADGGLTGEVRTFPHSGTGPDPERQEGPHAHFVGTVGGARWVVDLGTDELRLLEGGIAADVPPGTGPRHFVEVAGGVVVAGELDSTVHVLVAEGGKHRAVEQHPATATPAPDGGRNYPSHITATGSRVIVAVRGADVLSTFTVGSNDGAPVLAHLADTPTGGAWPRHFAVLDDLVVVANQNSSELTLLRLDPSTGHGTVLDRRPHPAPACVLPDPR